METKISTVDHSNFFEVKESRVKFMILGSGALLVAVFLLSFTPRIISVVTLIGGLIAFVGLVMVYKAFHIKTLLRIDRNGVLTSRQGMITWSLINDYSFENISKSAVLTLQCQPPYETVLIDLSMSTVKNLKQVTDAIAYFSDNLLPKNKTEQ